MKPSPQTLIALALFLFAGAYIASRQYTFQAVGEQGLFYRCNNWTGEVRLIDAQDRWVTIQEPINHSHL